MYAVSEVNGGVSRFFPPKKCIFPSFSLEELPVVPRKAVAEVSKIGNL